MIDEVEDVAKIYNWKHHIFEREFPKNSFGLQTYDNALYGIVISPPECEPVFLSFLSNGRMCGADSLQFWGKGRVGENEEYLYLLSTKTQYAGYHVHMIVIQLLRYLGKKYFIEFNVTDEGKYWETGDEHILKEMFNRYNRMLDRFATALETIPISQDESIEEFINRLANYIGNKKKE